MVTKKRLFVFTLVGLLLSLLLALPLTAVMQGTDELPLAARGSYHVGTRTLTFVDEQRGGREIQVLLWYPAVFPEDRTTEAPLRDAAPDTSSTPYPLVLYSHAYNGSPYEFSRILEPLVSHGFVVASLTHRNSSSALTFIDRPLDVLFVIEQLAAFNGETGSDLAGLMNIDQIGVIGFSLGSYTALAVSGARVDMEAASQYQDLLGIDYLRAWYHDWDLTAMAEYHDQVVPPEAGPLWAPMTDARIRAVVPYLPCEILFSSERALAAATVPTLLIGATEDEICGYDAAVALYTRMGSAERYLLTLLGAQHAVPGPDIEPVMQQFVTAFFGYYLQGKSEYAEYLTGDYAKSLDNVVWGIDEAAVIDPQYFEEITFIDSGTVAVGDTVAGEIADMGTRMGYALSLDADTFLNLYANATGPRTNDRSGARFDPVLYVLDGQGDVLFWNDEVTHDDDFQGIWDAGLDGIELTAGSYTIVVGGFHATGPYELVVASAASE
jgi:predicted dienelactone hydrolase